MILKSPVWMVLGVSGAAVSGGMERMRDRVIERRREGERERACWRVAFIGWIGCAAFEGGLRV